jgi:hypothetical protein
VITALHLVSATKSECGEFGSFPVAKATLPIWSKLPLAVQIRTSFFLTQTCRIGSRKTIALSTLKN